MERLSTDTFNDSCPEIIVTETVAGYDEDTRGREVGKKV
jgi:hypothetical protein